MKLVEHKEMKNASKELGLKLRKCKQLGRDSYVSEATDPQEKLTSPWAHVMHGSKPLPLAKTIRGILLFSLTLSSHPGPGSAFTVSFTSCPMLDTTTLYPFFLPIFLLLLHQLWSSKRKQSKVHSVPVLWDSRWEVVNLINHYWCSYCNHFEHSY